MLFFSILIVGILLGRAGYLQIMQKEFLQAQGNVRYLRTLPIIAHRGMLLDRNSEPLAVSSPVDSVWVHPQQFMTVKAQWSQLTDLLGMSPHDLEMLLAERMQREFVYVKRHISPNLAEKVKTLDLAGVFLQREYHRYYPAGEITAHLLGFTNIDDHGQEGLELALENFLTAVSGSKRVMQDRTGKIIADVEMLQLPHSGKDIRLSVDRRVQYFTYRGLKTAVHEHQAQAGSVVILDVHSGEVLAIANYPSFNPHERSSDASAHYRNRVVTDLFEPGSTVKPFTIAAALESGRYLATTPVNTRPGTLKIGEYTVRDASNYGTIDLKTILQKSSNVGASKIALSLPPRQLWEMMQAVGFGEISASGFPGEVAGRLPHFSKWYPVDNATLSFGYGLNVTLLQLARAYSAIGNQGILPPVRFLPIDEYRQSTVVIPRPIMQATTAQAILTMLEAVTQKGGTGTDAQIAGYRVAGKTGTVRKYTAKGYSDEDYFSLFVGLVPASKPRLVMAVLLDQPSGDSYYGGKVAAPVFAKVMAGVLRLLNIPPDNL